VLLVADRLDPALAADAQDSLLRTVRATVARLEDGYRVPVRDAALCGPDDLGLQIEIYLRWLDPEGYVGFGDHTHSYDVRVVAAPLASFSDGEDHEAATALFLVRSSGMHRPEVDDMALVEHVADQARRGLQRFVSAWWEDATPVQDASRSWLWLLPVGSVVLLGTIALRIVRVRRSRVRSLRRRRVRSDRHESDAGSRPHADDVGASPASPSVAVPGPRQEGPRR
jgi:hypothetical protein